MVKHQIIEECYRNPESKNIQDLINYLNLVSGKSLSLSIIRQYLLKLKWSKRDIKILSRCHCKAAAIYLAHISDKAKEINKNQIKTIAADIIPIVTHLEADSTALPNIRNSNTIPSFIHYHHAKSLFYDNDLPSKSKNSYETDLLVLYAVRLAMEKRIRGFLGIDYASVNNKHLGLSTLIQICKSLKGVNYASTIDWIQIEQLNAWLNHYMHRHLRPYLWTIHQSFEILNSILESTKYIHGDREIHSYYASTAVQNEEEFAEEILKKLQDWNKDIKVKWAWKREIVSIKS